MNMLLISVTYEFINPLDHYMVAVVAGFVVLLAYRFDAAHVSQDH